MSNPKTKEYAKKHSVVMVILKDGKILLEERTVAGTSYLLYQGGSKSSGKSLQASNVKRDFNSCKESS